MPLQYGNEAKIMSLDGRDEAKVTSRAKGEMKYDIMLLERDEAKIMSLLRIEAKIMPVVRDEDKIMPVVRDEAKIMPLVRDEAKVLDEANMMPLKRGNEAEIMSRERR